MTIRTFLDNFTQPAASQSLKLNDLLAAYREVNGVSSRTAVIVELIKRGHEITEAAKTSYVDGLALK